MFDPAFEVASFLSNAGLNLDIGNSLFISTIRDLGNPNLIADTCVFVYARSGRIPTRSMGGIFEIRYPVVNITVRSKIYADGRKLAIDIMNTLRNATTSGLNPLPALDIESLQSEPDASGQDNEGRFLWNMSFVVKYQEG